MTVMQKEDEVDQFPSRNRLPLSLSLEVSGKGALSNVLKQDSLLNNSDTLYPCKRKFGSPLPKNTKRLNFGSNMLNGYRNDGHRDENSSDSLPVATLSNMGNTCYLNSILYTLRFTPAFLHNLHHLVVDLTMMHTKMNQTKAKSSSLGRNITGITGPNNRSSSSKDLLSLGSTINDLCPKSKMQTATEKLHDLFVSLHTLEMKDNNEPYQPSSFLQALIEVNSLYQGNQQQDAHELLVYILDILRETCDLLAKQAENQIEIHSDIIENDLTSTNINKSWTVRRSRKKTKETSKKLDKGKEKSLKENEILMNGASNESDEHSSAESVPTDKTPKKSLGYNFVSEDFGGITLRRTKCLECECVTERKEPFYDICVPIPLIESDPELTASDIYRAYCVTSENLRDTNKYWCENCVRYNEACREVSYERLPNLLVLQLKRFSTSVTGPEKMNNYLPTPLVLDCFCDQCSHLDDDKKLHSYQLYSVIMHLGATMASGHYIAYTRASEYRYEYNDCVKESSKVTFSSASSDGSNKSFFKFFKQKVNTPILNSSSNESIKSGLSNIKNGPLNGPTLCKSKDCCGIKISKSVLENAINSSARDVRLKKSTDSGQIWLECDDDVVRTLSTEEFQNQILGCKKNSPATPYLLFYSKIKENPSSSSSSD